MHLKNLKLLLTVSVGLMFLVIAFNNVADYYINFNLVKMVVSMENVSMKVVQWRAITNPLLQHVIYISIIVWESLTAVVCLLGSWWMFRGKESLGVKVSVTGLGMGFALFMIGFVVIAGEWFYLWDTMLSAMHAKALLYSLMLGSFAYFVSVRTHSYTAE